MHGRRRLCCLRALYSPRRRGLGGRTRAADRTGGRRPRVSSGPERGAGLRDAEGAARVRGGRGQRAGKVQGSSVAALAPSRSLPAVAFRAFARPFAALAVVMALVAGV
jgi:hypothetical protein